MSERAERIGSFSDDKIIKMHEKWRQLFVEGFAPNIGKREAATPIGARSFLIGRLIRGIGPTGVQAVA